MVRGLFSGNFDYQFFIISLPFFMIAVMLHEVGHAYSALRCGDPTAKLMGRLSLNPGTHIDPVGALAFLLVGFGWAKPVPINPLNFKEYRRDMIIVSLAGVAVNLALAFVGVFLIKIFIMTGLVIFQNGNLYANSQGSLWTLRIAFFFIQINILLLVFNLLPVPPLDGSKILMMALPQKQALAYEKLAPYSMIIFIVLIVSGVFWTIFSFVWGIMDSVFTLIYAL